MSYRITGPNLDKTMSATETKSVLCANKMMGGNIVISRVTSEPEQLVITGPNLSKTDQTGTILCKDKMMGGNVQFAHTLKAQLALSGMSNSVYVVYNGVTYKTDGVYTVERGKSLTVHMFVAYNISWLYLNGVNVASTSDHPNEELVYTMTIGSNINAIAVNRENATHGYDNTMDIETGAGNIVSFNINPDFRESAGAYIYGWIDPTGGSNVIECASGYLISGKTAKAYINYRYEDGDSGVGIVFINGVNKGYSPVSFTVGNNNISGYLDTWKQLFLTI